MITNIKINLESIFLFSKCFTFHAGKSLFLSEQTARDTLQCDVFSRVFAETLYYKVKNNRKNGVVQTFTAENSCKNNTELQIVKN